MVHTHVNQTPPCTAARAAAAPSSYQTCIRLMSDVTLDCTCKEGFLAGDWFCSHWFQQTEEAHLCYYLKCKQELWAPHLAQLHPGGKTPLNTGISPLIPHEFILIFWYFMSQERDYSSSSKVLFPWWQQSGPGDHILPSSTPATVNSKQGETFPRKQPASPPGSRCFSPPRSFLSPNTPSCTHPSGPGLMTRAQVPWAGSPLLLCAAPRAAWHLLKYL